MVSPTTFTINITIKDVTDLYSFNFSLNYSTTVLTATAVTLGSFFPPNSQIVHKEINDTLRYVRYNVKMPLGSPAGVTGVIVLILATTVVYFIKFRKPKPVAEGTLSESKG